MAPKKKSMKVAAADEGSLPAPAAAKTKTDFKAEMKLMLENLGKDDANDEADDDGAVMKRPAGAVTDDAVMKRPAGAFGRGMKRPAAAVNKMKDTSDPRDGHGRSVQATKDRGKQRHYTLNQAELPKNIQDMVKNASSHNTKTIINNLVVRHADGSYSFEVDNCVIAEKITKYDETFGTDTERGIPETLAELKFGSREKLDQAVAKGEAQKFTVDNVNFYKWRELSAGKKWGRRDEHIASGKKQIDGETYKAFTDQLRSLSWEIASSSNKENKLMDESGKIHAKCRDGIEKAQKATDKTLQEAKKLLKNFITTSKEDKDVQEKVATAYKETYF